MEDGIHDSWNDDILYCDSIQWNLMILGIYIIWDKPKKGPRPFQGKDLPSQNTFMTIHRIYVIRANWEIGPRSFYLRDNLSI